MTSVHRLVSLDGMPDQDGAILCDMNVTRHVPRLYEE